MYKIYLRHIIDDEKIMQLSASPSVLITVRQAFLTKEILTEIVQTKMENILVYSKGQNKGNEVTKQVMS